MKEVADALKITVRTVAAHKYAVMELLQLKNNAELVQYAIKHKIISHLAALRIPSTLLVLTNNIFPAERIVNAKFHTWQVK